MCRLQAAATLFLPRLYHRGQLEHLKLCKFRYKREGRPRTRNAASNGIFLALLRPHGYHRFWRSIERLGQSCWLNVYYPGFEWRFFKPLVLYYGALKGFALLLRLTTFSLLLHSDSESYKKSRTVKKLIIFDE